MDRINFNGDVFPADQAVFTADNRGFNYGDGLFETMRKSAGTILWQADHLQRLHTGLEMLGISFTLTERELEEEVAKITDDRGHYRIKLTVFREAGGLYIPQKNKGLFLLQSQPLDQAPYPFDEVDHIDICRSVRLSATAYSPLKTISCLPYILAGQYKRKHGLGDCLLLNQNGDIAEASSSNIFLVDRDGKVISPGLDQGCIAGVMRRQVIRLCAALQIPLAEQVLRVEDLEHAREVFLTNSVQGISPVRRFQEKEYEVEWSRKLHQAL